MGKIGVAGTSSPNYLPKLASKYKLLGRLTQHQFTAAMTNMETAGQLVTRVVGTNSNRTKRNGLVLS